MERESLLTLLIVVCSGLLLQLLAWWPLRVQAEVSARYLERRYWVRLWAPAVPAFIAAAWLCGWALSEPDPVPDRLGVGGLVAVCVPFAVLFLRALARAVWSLLSEPEDCGIYTVGLLRPYIVFSPFLARQLDETAVHAALEHERAHARHRDPLRMWLAQFITDLQWPWPAAQKRQSAWLYALECARDDEARANGVDGADLAAAVLATMRFHQFSKGKSPINHSTADARLVGDMALLRTRVSRLLAPLPEPTHDAKRFLSLERVALLLIPVLLSALVLGDRLGELVLRPLLMLTS